jgi:hypothetical protein
MWVGMADGEDWLWRPFANGMCKYESVIDGTLSLADIATMNDVLTVKQENEVRYMEANE